MGSGVSTIDNSSTLTSEQVKELVGAEHYNEEKFNEFSIDGNILASKLLELIIEYRKENNDNTKGKNDYNDLIFIVCDEKNIGNRKNTKLANVYDCDEWRQAVSDANLDNELFLVESTYDEFLSLSNAEVLSYRWSNIITINCSVYSPGSSSPSETRKSDISLDVFRKLKGLSNSYVWIDYLSHLNNEQHKSEVIRKMGSLYVQGMVFPLYLQDYYVHANEYSSMLSSSLRRGWIQQEISYGCLQRDIVNEFVKVSIEKKDYSNLGTLIRRRAYALKWAFDKAKSLGKMDDRKTPDMVDKDKDAPVHKHINFKLFDSSPPRGDNSNVYECIKLLVEESSVSDSSFIDDLTNALCMRNRFNPDDIFCVQSLLRSFAESALTYEEDAYIAMTQVSAISCGLTKVDAINPLLAVLRISWLKILEDLGKNSLRFSMSRSLETDWTLGLPELFSHIKSAIERKDDYLVIETVEIDEKKSTKIIFTFGGLDHRLKDVYVTSSKSCDMSKSKKKGTTVFVDLLSVLRAEMKENQTI